MANEQYVPLILIAMGVFQALLLQWIWVSFLKNRRDTARRDFATGEFFLEYSRTMRRFPLWGTVFWIGLFSFIVLRWGLPTWSDLPGVTMAAVAIGVPLIGLAVEFVGVHHSVSRQGIVRRSPWRRQMFAPWRDVVEVIYSKSGRMFVVRALGGNIRIPDMLDGLWSFGRALQDYLPEEKWKGAAPWLPEPNLRRGR